MRKEEIKKKFDEIVVFSEVEKFLDTPMKSKILRPKVRVFMQEKRIFLM